jgi:hypothetical protein
VSLVEPVSLSESRRILGEVIDGLCELLLREFSDRVQSGSWSVRLRILNGERSGVRVLPSGLSFEELEVDGLWAVCEGGNIQGETEQAVGTQESGRGLHLILQVLSTPVDAEFDSRGWRGKPTLSRFTWFASHATSPVGPLRTCTNTLINGFRSPGAVEVPLLRHCTKGRIVPHEMKIFADEFPYQARGLDGTSIWQNFH